MVQLDQCHLITPCTYLWLSLHFKVIFISMIFIAEVSLANFWNLIPLVEYVGAGYGIIVRVIYRDFFCCRSEK